jgi:uncharacterized protein
MEPNPKTLEVLICPQSRTRLEYNKENQELISKAAKLAYPIRNGVPIMLVNEARELD